MFRKNLFKGVLTVAIMMFTATTCFAQQYYNGYQPNEYYNNYTQPAQIQPYNGYQPAYYSDNYAPQPVYDPYYQQQAYNKQRYYKN